MSAAKFDGKKVRLHLVPNELTEGAARAFGYGAEKYARYNWMKGMDWSRLHDALRRHLAAWFDGEEVDPESELSHLYHAAASLAMLMGHVERGLGKDDRPCTDPDPDRKEVVESKPEPEGGNPDCEDRDIEEQLGQDCSRFTCDCEPACDWRENACPPCRKYYQLDE